MARYTQKKINSWMSAFLSVLVIVVLLCLLFMSVNNTQALKDMKKEIRALRRKNLEKVTTISVMESTENSLSQESSNMIPPRYNDHSAKLYRRWLTDAKLDEQRPQNIEPKAEIAEVYKYRPVREIEIQEPELSSYRQEQRKITTRKHEKFVFMPFRDKYKLVSESGETPIEIEPYKDAEERKVDVESKEEDETSDESYEEYDDEEEELSEDEKERREVYKNLFDNEAEALKPINDLVDKLEEEFD